MGKSKADLERENKELKEQLRRYEGILNTIIEKDYKEFEQNENINLLMYR